MKNIYFIDYENVGQSGFNGSEALTSADEIYLFHYEGTGNVKYENLISLAGSKARTQIIKLTTHAKNAMDFQIVALLGYLTGKYQNKANYVIVSKDKGYESAIECILATVDPNLKITSQPSISGETGTQMFEDEIRSALDGVVIPKIINRAVKAAVEARDLGSLHEKLQHEIPKDCARVYALLKPAYKRKAA